MARSPLRDRIVAGVAAGLVEKIREGKHPPDERLAYLIRHHDGPLPPDIREYVAARVEGTIKLSRGRPGKEFDTLGARAGRAKKPSDNPLLCALAAHRVRRLHRVYRDRYKLRSGRAGPGGEGAYPRALREVAEQYGIPESTLDKHVYPRRPDLRSELRDLR